MIIILPKWLNAQEEVWGMAAPVLYYMYVSLWGRLKNLSFLSLFSGCALTGRMIKKGCDFSYLRTLIYTYQWVFILEAWKNSFSCQALKMSVTYHLQAWGTAFMQSRGKTWVCYWPVFTVWNLLFTVILFILIVKFLVWNLDTNL